MTCCDRTIQDDARDWMGRCGERFPQFLPVLFHSPPLSLIQEWQRRLARPGCFAVSPTISFMGRKGVGGRNPMPHVS